MPTIVLIAGILIIVTAFSYSYITTVGREADSLTTLVDSSVQSMQRKAESHMMMEEMSDDMNMGSMMMFRDGEYKTKVSYMVPYGYVESMEVMMRLSGGIVEVSSVSFDPSVTVSRDYQIAFESYFEDEVVGNIVEAVSLSRVGGASLTNAAFDEAVTIIKAEASGNTYIPKEIVQLSNYSEVSDGVDMDNSVDITYEDGRYVVDNTYDIMPGLIEDMQTAITLKNGKIIDVEVVFTSPNTHMCAHKQSFSSLYKDEIIGLPLTNTPNSRIGIASLTTEAFNKALNEVRVQARI